MNNAKLSLSKNAVLSAVAAAVLLALGIGLGYALAHDRDPAPPQTPPPATSAPDDEHDAHGPAGADMSGTDAAHSPDGEGTVRIARSVAGALGITSVPAEEGTLRRSIRSTGHVTYDETRLSRVSPRFGGWVERIHVDFTGRFVEAGEPLLEIYSPELVSAQEELLAAHRLDRSLAASVAPGVTERSGELVEAARQRLRLWDISPEQIQAIEEGGEVRRTLTIHAPRSGFVVEKDVELGASVQPGTDLYRIAELSRVWLEVEVHERDIRFARLGDAVQVRVDAYPAEAREGRIAYVYPDVGRQTRTARVRVELPNSDPDRMLRPGMFATAHLDALVAERAVLVPRDAVLHFGDRDIVFVEREPGTYEVREVQVGATADGRTQLLEGVAAGEAVVSRANFILDAESRLMETMLGQPGMEMEMDEMDDMDMEMDVSGEMDDATGPDGMDEMDMPDME